jgi:hypothetical protein
MEEVEGRKWGDESRRNGRRKRTMEGRKEEKEERWPRKGSYHQ